MYSEITGDLLGISKRLQDINKKYHTFWNGRDARFEVHTNPNPNIWTLGFVVPYEKLDERTIEYAHRTLKENSDDIEAEINSHNDDLVKSASRGIKNAEMSLAEMFEYAKKASHPVIFTKNYLKEF